MDGTCNTPGWKNFWKLPLLTVSILSSSVLQTRVEAQSALIPVASEPLFPTEGQDVILRPEGDSMLLCSWFRGPTVDQENRIFTYYLLPPGRQVNGPAYTGRETVGSDCSLQLKNLTADDSGNYTVTQGAARTYKTGYAHLIVSEFLAKPAISAYPSPIVAEFSGSVVLTCVTSSTLANVYWLWNGQPLGENPRIQLSGDNRTLTLQSTLRGDAGRYQCQVTNLASSVLSDVMHVEVIYGPDLPTIQPSERSYMEHSDLKLSCTASVFPSANFAWFFNGRECGSGPELLISNMTLEKAGTYTCQAENIISLQRRSAALEIQVVAAYVHNITISGPSEAIENQPVSLHCASAGASVSYSWFKGGQKLEAGSRVFLTNNSQILTLNPSSRSDAGNYTCLGSNSISSSTSAPHHLGVIYGPDIPVISEEIYIERSKVHLSCKAVSFPEATYVWLLNGKELPGKPATVLRDFAPAESGNYTCQAENILSRQKSNTTLVLNMSETRNTEATEKQEETLKLQ